jgi:hypothetical protein
MGSGEGGTEGEALDGVTVDDVWSAGDDGTPHPTIVKAVAASAAGANFMPKPLARDEADPDGAAARMGDSPVTSGHLVPHHLNVARAAAIGRKGTSPYNPTCVVKAGAVKLAATRADCVATVHVECDAAR